MIGNNILNECFYNNLLTYRSSSPYSQLLFAHIMLKIIFMRYLRSVRPKLVSTLKVPRI